MLIRPTAEEAEKYIDFAYELALDPTRSGYPTYTDGIKTKEDFVESCRFGFSRDDRQTLLYLENGTVSGWIKFLLEKESGYIETNIFNIAGNFQYALQEFVAYCRENFAGYRVYMGFPGDNQAAVDYLTKIGWPCEEHSYNNVLFFENYELIPESENIVRVTRENYVDFRKLHEAVQGSMYWNADRLYESLDHWDIFMCHENGEPTAAIYNRDAEILMHIYGVDYQNNIYQPEAFRILMAKTLNECKRNNKTSMVFFGDEENQQDALAMGYHCVGEYVMFAGTV